MFARRHRGPAAAGLALLVVVVVATAPPGPPPAAAADAWPPSAGLVLAEVMTGGASASDEFVELYNRGSAAASLTGLELAYASSTGATVTRKASWSDGPELPPGGHLLLANAAGNLAGVADVTYSGGLAATGGSLALRTDGGGVVDALAWGDVSGGFVEGSAAPAPPAGSSLERRPGQGAGNGQDTNDNAADFVVQAVPGPQRLADPPVEPTPIPTGEPIPTPTELPTPPPTAPPTPTATATSIPVPTPTDEPIPTPTPTSAASPTPAVRSVAEARGLPLGSEVVVDGVLTTALGWTDAGRGGYVQDSTAGIALYVDGTDVPSLPLGRAVAAHGVLDTRYAQLTLHVTAAGLTDLGAGNLPEPVAVATGGIGESTEGRLVATVGQVVSAATALTDGFAATVDDGSGPVRIVAPSASGIDPAAFASGMRIALTGVAGQRDSSGTGTAGYRVTLRGPADVTALPSSVPTATPAPVPSPTATVGPTPAANPTGSPGVPSPTPSPAPTGLPTPIAVARGLDNGQRVTVRGVVTAELGRVVDDRSFAIQDGSGGITVHLDDALAVPPPQRGMLVELTGSLGSRHDNREMRLEAGDRLDVLGASVVPQPQAIEVAELGEATEGRLVSLSGTISDVSASATGTVTIVVEAGGVQARVVLLRGVGGSRSDYPRHASLAAVGVAGQYSSAHGRPDGYRVWVRDLADVRLMDADPSASAGPALTSGPGRGNGSPGRGSSLSASARSASRTAMPGAVDVDLGELAAHAGQLVRASGLVALLAPDHVRLDDGTGQADVRLTAGLRPVAEALRLGDALNVVGRVAQAGDGWEIVPRGPQDFVVAPDPGLEPAVGSPSPTSAPAASLSRFAPAAAPAPGPREAGPAPVLLAIALALVAAGGLAIAMLVRRRRTERLFSRRVRERLSGMARAPRTDVATGPGGPAAGPLRGA